MSINNAYTVRKQGGDYTGNQFPRQLEAAWPEDGLERISTCPVCGSHQRKLLYEHLTDRVFFCAPGEWTLYSCESCGSGYLDPRPTPDSIAIAYSSYFTHSGEWRKSPESLTPLRRLLRSLSNGYFNHRFGTHFEPATHWGFWLAFLTPFKRRKLEVVGRHLPKPEENQALLDVGCGNGIFLDFARQAGWQASGVDFDSSAVSFCIQKGLDVQQGSIKALVHQAERFDWITLSHVVEHVHDPIALLVDCFCLLKPGGSLWIETPNFDSLGHRYFGSDWYALDPPRHLVMFNRASLVQALSRTGYQNIVDAPFRPLYKNTALKSKAITDGRDPYAVSVSRKPSLKTLAADLRAWANPALREVITLTARKAA